MSPKITPLDGMPPVDFPKLGPAFEKPERWRGKKGYMSDIVSKLKVGSWAKLTLGNDPEVAHRWQGNASHGARNVKARVRTITETDKETGNITLWIQRTE